MRKVTLSLLAVAGLALVAQSASAADLRRPVYKAPPPAVVAAYNWSGFYLGGHVGGAWSSEEARDLATGLTGATDPDGFIGGLQAGYNWQADRWVFGIEGDWSWSGADGSTPLVGVPFTSNDSWYATLTGRVGYAWDNWLWYVKGGAAWADKEYTYAGFGTFSDTRVGWTIGTGVEWALGPQWSAKLEYNYLDFGKDTYTFGAFPIDVDSQVHLVKAGINYRFGGWGKAPVVANY
jgi:outer membrane immunogenic protein